MNIDKAFKILKEELLLEGKSWDNFYESLNKRLKVKINNAVEKARREKVDEVKDKNDILNGIKKVDPTATENNAGKYSEWLIKTTIPIWLTLFAVNNGNRLNTDVLKSFNQIQSNLEKKDINEYKDINELRDVIDEYETQKSTKKLKGKVDLQSGKYGIKKIDTAKESCELGSGTRWCITDKSSFETYNERTNIFFLTDGKNKYAVTIARKFDEGDRKDTIIVYDEQDEKVGGIKFLNKNFPKEIVNFISKESKVNEEFSDGIKADNKTGMFSIYKNPTSKELKEILKENDGSKEIRVIVDIENEDVYAFPGEFLHKEASKKLGIEHKSIPRKRIFTTGFFVPTSNKMMSLKIRSLKADLTEKQITWLKKFFII